MHICMVSTGFYPILPHRVGAIEPFVYGLSKELALTNYVDVFGFGRSKEEVGNLCIHAFSYGENNINMLKNFLGHRLAYQIPFNTYLLKNILLLHKKKSIDILHIHDAHSGLTATISKLALGIPYVCSIHNEIRMASPIRACDKVLAVSEYIKNFLIKKRKLTKVEVLPVAVDIDVYNPRKSVEQAKKELGLQDHNIVLFAGRKCPEKGPQILVEALPKIVRYNPRTLAVFVGPDYFFDAPSMTYTKFLVTKAEKLHVKNNVIFEGFISNDTLRQYYNAADVFVFPSIWPEPFGKVILEAMSFEKPVIASSVGGVPEIVANGVNGLLVPPNNPDALASSVNYLLENTEIAKELGENGRKTVLEKYCFEKVGKRCSEIYEELV